MAKGISKRAYHKRDMDQLNKTALRIGAVLGILSLVAIIFSLIK